MWVVLTYIESHVQVFVVWVCLCGEWREIRASESQTRPPGRVVHRATHGFSANPRLFRFGYRAYISRPLRTCSCRRIVPTFLDLRRHVQNGLCRAYISRLWRTWLVPYRAYIGSKSPPLRIFNDISKNRSSPLARIVYLFCRWRLICCLFFVGWRALAVVVVVLFVCD
jgi:hypothetical protein